MKYSIIRSKRKTLSIEIADGGEVLVRAPMRISDREVDQIVVNRSQWIASAKARAALRPEKRCEDIPKLTALAQSLVPNKIMHYSSIMNLYPKSVKITKAKTRFGSCSSNGRICVSCFLMLYPEEAIDYVIVHELAHIAEHNHSKSFYSIIEKILPDYKERIKMLK